MNGSSQNPIDDPFSQDELIRYSRHFVLPEIGIKGQSKLKAARVLCVGAGGLGSPLLLYLAAAGIGALGVIDPDYVDLSNLQRQVLYTTADIGKSKSHVAKAKLLGLNPQLNLDIYDVSLNRENALTIMEKFDIVVDGTDNFATRYLINDACFHLKKPNVFASIFQFEGQCSVFNSQGAPCYRCLYPEPPPAGLIPNCAEGGVLGVLAGLVGTIQAMEVVKLVLGIGKPLVGRLLTIDALSMSFKEYAIHKNPECCLCNKKHSFESLRSSDSAYCDVNTSFNQKGITVQELHEMQQKKQDFVLLDVRDEHEFAICNLGGLLIPLPQLKNHLDRLDRDKLYIVHCKKGLRSQDAIKMMSNAGFTQVKYLKGGIDSWAKEIDPTMPVY